MSQNYKNGQTTQTSNVKMARLLWVNIAFSQYSQTPTAAHFIFTNESFYYIWHPKTGGI